MPEDPEDRFRPASFCDPRNSCGADILTDLLNCGECGNVCQFDNASAYCDRGVCRMGDCETGWDNCGDASRLGCYDSLKEREHCGACGNECTDDAPYCECVDDTSDCENWHCVDRCDPPKTDCDGACVDTDKSYDHCGDCDHSCGALLNLGSAECSEGACVVLDCADDYESCDTLHETGCETLIGTTGNCGGCGDMCQWSNSEQPSCVDGLCQFDCDDGWEDCNLLGSDGCEAEMGTMENCEFCGDVCSPNEACSDRGCMLRECVWPLTECGVGNCVDTAIDPDHCGVCFDGCALGLECIGGFCGGEGIRCENGLNCTVAERACCLPLDICVTPGTCVDFGTIELQCDSADDCSGGEVCCLTPSTGSEMAFCSPACSNDLSLCSRNSQCLPGEVCCAESPWSYGVCRLSCQ